MWATQWSVNGGGLLSSTHIYVHCEPTVPWHQVTDWLTVVDLLAGIIILRGEQQYHLEDEQQKIANNIEACHRGLFGRRWVRVLELKLCMVLRTIFKLHSVFLCWVLAVDDYVHRTQPET